MIDSTALTSIAKYSIVERFVVAKTASDTNSDQQKLEGVPLLKSSVAQKIAKQNIVTSAVVKENPIGLASQVDFQSSAQRAAPFSNQSLHNQSLHNQSPLPRASTHSHLYLDNVSLAQLKHDNTQQGLIAAAQQFEALFLQQMLKRMRAASEVLSDDDNPLSIKSAGMFQEMRDAQLAQQISRQSSFGLAEMIYQQLSAQVPNLDLQVPDSKQKISQFMSVQGQTLAKEQE
ncbi:rod-binding protein [Vibrio nomapromontoriensis]|uniref:rod-binding protein n=1 Tax=Vibrio nomapromontoriensis TaxID=2910246 RepID=UPI003D111FDB